MIEHVVDEDGVRHRLADSAVGPAWAVYRTWCGKVFPWDSRFDFAQDLITDCEACLVVEEKPYFPPLFTRTEP